MSVNTSSSALWIVLAGYLAAIHVGKLSPILPLLQQQLGLSLTQAGTALSLVQAASMLLALSLGIFSEKIGLKQCMSAGLVILGVASMAGMWVNSTESLFLFRFAEGIGFLLITLCAPALLKQISAPETLNLRLGLWGSYMGLGVGIAMLGIPLLLALISWQEIWAGLGMACLVVAVVLQWQLPAELKRTQQAPAPFWQVLKVTLSHLPIWGLAFIFACYTSQWLTVIGFLPSLYLSHHISLETAGILTALASMSNITGTFLAGFLLQRNISPGALIKSGFIVMALMSWVAFSDHFNAAFSLQYLSVVLFSIISGLIPPTVFALSLSHAPRPNATAASIGLILQVSALAQFLIPPLAAALVSHTQHWADLVWVSGTLSLCGVMVAGWLFRAYPSRAAKPKQP